jgi:RNase P subunit RPR2
MEYADFTECVFEPNHIERGRDQFGYGLKISSKYKVKIGEVWRRVYISCISNCSSCFVIMNNKRVVIDDLKLYEMNKRTVM